ncbi:MBG domain-containing protein [Geotalea uraniireducens]|uniref:MBG domain-containing protein n=1 Tax=Geotalea uraniireducens (strain Rf4) TaxID=351605 RepID=A5GBS2_GEOUR|nr:MBG domain-containing protein [Geotalea uraniireducens]ABQ24975.1 hypothetical protein Gura_0767 [Geotalea uraniireducens Rf4]
MKKNQKRVFRRLQKFSTGQPAYLRLLVWPIIALTLVFGQAFIVSPAMALGGSYTPAVSAGNVSAGSATLTLKFTGDSSTLTGNFTLLAGNGASCGSSAQVIAGTDSADKAIGVAGSVVLRSGSVPNMSVATDYPYTVGNLSAATSYTACFTSSPGSTPASASFSTTAATPQVGAFMGTASDTAFTGIALPSVMAIAPDGAPYVAFGYLTSGGVAHKATVKRFNSQTKAWEPVGAAEFTVDAANSISLAFAPNGAAYLASSDDNTTNGTKVMSFNGATSTWEAVGATPVSAGSTGFNSLAFAPDGTPYVALVEFANGGQASGYVKVKRLNGSTWEDVGALPADYATYSSLAFTPNGGLYLAYVKTAHSGADWGTATVKFLANPADPGATWADINNDPSSSYIYGVSGLSLAIAPNGTPHVAFMDADTRYPIVMRYLNGAWIKVWNGSANITAGRAAGMGNLVIAPDGTPYLATADENTDRSQTPLFGFNGTDWIPFGSNSTIYNWGQTAQPTVAIAPNGIPYVLINDINTFNPMIMKANTDPILAGVTTGAASNITTTGATVAGTVNTTDGGTTTVSFEYGADTRYGSHTTPVTGQSAGASASASITGLFCGATYHYRIKGTSSRGPAYGSDNTFATLDCQPGPALTTPSASNITVGGGATLQFQASAVSTGYYTVMAGADVTCGTALQIRGGKDSNGNTAAISGSMALQANTPASIQLNSLTNAAYTVCFTAGTSSTLATVASFNLLTRPDFSWQPLGTAGAFSGDASYIKLAISPTDNTPYVVFQNNVPGDPDNGKAVVKSYNGTSWSTVGSGGFSTGDASFISMAIDSNGKPYVAYQDSGNSGKATVKSYNNGTWGEIGVTGGFSSGLAQYISMTFAPMGNVPYVAYADGSGSNNGSITMQENTTGSWSVDGTGTAISAANASSISLASDSYSQQYVAYIDGSDLNNKQVKVRYYYNDPAFPLWDNYPAVSSNSLTDLSNLSLAVASDCTLYVAYLDGGQITVKTPSQSGPGWNEVGALASVAGTVTYPTLLLSPDNTPYVVYIDSSNGKVMVMRYTAGAWSPVIGATSGGSIGTGQKPSLAFDKDGIAYVAYWDVATSKIVVKKAATASAAVTGKAGNISTSGVTLNGTVSANGAATTVSFEYGATTTYGTTVSATPGSLSASDSDVAVSAHITGSFTPGATYHFRVKAVNPDFVDPITGSDQTFTVPKIDQATLSVTGISGSAYYGQSGITAGVSGGNGSGAVTYSAGSSTACSVDATSGAVSITSGSGTCAIIATKAADSTYNAATSAAATLTVTTASQSALSVTGISGSAYYGQSGITAAALGGLGTGAVSYSAGSSTACTVDATSGAVSITSGSGACAITATKAADGNYNAATSAAATLTVTRATATVTLGSLTATYDGTAKSASATTTPTGKTVTFTYDGSATAPASAGSYAVIGTISDSNYQGAATGTLVIATATAPTLKIFALADGSITNTATLNISGSAAGANAIKSITINGVAVSPAADGSFSYAVTLQSGKNTITTVATDNADLTASDSRSIILDTTAPAITISSLADNSALAAASVTITGTVDKTATVQATVNNGTAQSAAMTGTSFSVTLNLEAGSNIIEVKATDLSGNSTMVKRTVVSDTTRPTLAITDPVQDMTTNLASMTISGTVTDALTAVSVTITCDGNSYTSQVVNGAFQQQISFTTAKQYAISVTATDQAGNNVTAQRNVIYAPSTPTPTLPSGDINGDGKVDISDALLALQMAVGLATPSPAQLAAGDVAPLVNDKPSSDGVIDIADAMLILEKAVGMLTW